MSEIEALRKQMAEIQAKIDDHRTGAVASVKEAIAKYDMTAEELGLGSKRTRAVEAGNRHFVAKTNVAPKYRDPKSGSTWSGRGIAPAWIRGAKNRDAFLIG